jgi:hypothetical protein
VHKNPDYYQVTNLGLRDSPNKEERSNRKKNFNPQFYEQKEELSLGISVNALGQKCRDSSIPAHSSGLLKTPGSDPRDDRTASHSCEPKDRLKSQAGVLSSLCGLPKSFQNRKLAPIDRKHNEILSKEIDKNIINPLKKFENKQINQSKLIFTEFTCFLDTNFLWKFIIRIIISTHWSSVTKENSVN